MVAMGWTFVKNVTANAAAQMTQLFQSGKFSGVMRISAAAPMSPITDGRSQAIVFSNT